MTNMRLLDHVGITITHLQDDEDYTEEHDGEEHEHDQACNRQQMAISMSRSWVYLVATMNLATGIAGDS